MKRTKLDHGFNRFFSRIKRMKAPLSPALFMFIILLLSPLLAGKTEAFLVFNEVSGFNLNLWNGLTEPKMDIFDFYLPNKDLGNSGNNGKGSSKPGLGNFEVVVATQAAEEIENYIQALQEATTYEEAKNSAMELAKIVMGENFSRSEKVRAFNALRAILGVIEVIGFTETEFPEVKKAIVEALGYIAQELGLTDDTGREAFEALATALEKEIEQTVYNAVISQMEEIARQSVESATKVFEKLKTAYNGEDAKKIAIIEAVGNLAEITNRDADLKEKVKTWLAVILEESLEETDPIHIAAVEAQQAWGITEEELPDLIEEFYSAYKNYDEILNKYVKAVAEYWLSQSREEIIELFKFLKEDIASLIGIVIFSAEIPKITIYGGYGGTLTESITNMHNYYGYEGTLIESIIKMHNYYRIRDLIYKAGIKILNLIKEGGIDTLSRIFPLHSLKEFFNIKSEEPKALLLAQEPTAFNRLIETWKNLTEELKRKTKVEIWGSYFYINPYINQEKMIKKLSLLHETNFKEFLCEYLIVRRSIYAFYQDCKDPEARSFAVGRNPSVWKKLMEELIEKLMGEN